ncbi:MAG: hypothetical protein ABEI77_04365 [Halorientalis sp.]
MQPERKVLLGDALVGLSPLVAAALSLDSAVGWRDALLGLVCAVVVAGLLYLSEHDAFEGVASEPVTIALLVAVPFTLVFVLVLVNPGTVPWFLAAFVGAGLGLLGYRFVYGIVRPVPEKRLEQARERAI